MAKLLPLLLAAIGFANAVDRAEMQTRNGHVVVHAEGFKVGTYAIIKGQRNAA